MTERRTLAAGMNVVPNVNPEVVRAFISQESPSEPSEPEATPIRNGPSTARPVDFPEPPPRRKPTALKPIGLIPVTVRLHPEIASGLKRASLERQLAGEEVYTQQDIVEQAITPWLKARGFL